MRAEGKMIRKRDKKIVVFWSVVIVFTLLRLVIGANTLLIVRTEWGHDDGLMIGQIISFYHLKWLGSWNPLLLIKGGVYAAYIGMLGIFRIPYFISLYGLYIFADIVLLVAIKPIVRNRWVRLGIYLFLLFSPVMFHRDVVQYVYRNALLPGTSLLIVASYIGLFFRRRKRKKMIPWAIYAGIGMGLFYYLCENSIWLGLFAIGASIITVIYVCIEQEPQLKSRVAMLLIPFLMMMLVRCAFSICNSYAYDTTVLNSRMDTSFKTMMAKMIQVKRHPEDTNLNIWITSNMMEDIINASPTLQSIEKEIQDSYVSWGWDTGEISGDFTQWVMLTAMSNAGVYENMAEGEAFCEKVATELDTAFEEGSLKRTDVPQLRISAMARGITVNDIPSVIDNFGRALYSTLTFRQAQSTIEDSTGSVETIQEISRIFKTTNVQIDGACANELRIRQASTISNLVIRIYQVISIPIIVLSVVGYILTFVEAVLTTNKARRKCLIQILLVVTGLVGCFLVLELGNSWYMSFFHGENFEKWLLYYCVGGLTVAQVAQGLCISRIIERATAIWKSKQERY